jgi:hypothetical protein
MVGLPDFRCSSVASSRKRIKRQETTGPKFSIAEPQIKLYAKPNSPRLDCTLDSPSSSACQSTGILLHHRHGKLLNAIMSTATSSEVGRSVVGHMHPLMLC